MPPARWVGSSSRSWQRFEREAEVLARLQHPGIAQVFELGTTEAGHGPQPYFAMEYVEEQPLTEYADTRPFNARKAGASWESL
jgi:non-specific serine/threonine protein kinase/serine/threonine-protein kinase